MNANAEIIAELRRVLNERDEARRERDEARASCPDCAMWAERSARWHDDMQRAERERDEARAELSKLRKDYDSVLEANVGLLDGAPYVDARAAFRRGAEAMRKRCEELVKHNSHEDGIGMGSQRIESAIRAVPIPEEP